MTTIPDSHLSQRKQMARALALVVLLAVLVAGVLCTVPDTNTDDVCADPAQDCAAKSSMRPDWGGGGVQRMEEWGTWASRTRERGEASFGRPEGGGGAWAAKTVKRPPQQPAQPPVRHWAPLTHEQHPP